MPDTTHLHTIARKRRWTHADAVCLVTAWNDTGDSLAAFARAIGCHHIRLRRWAKHLETTPTPTPTTPIRFMQLTPPPPTTPIELIIEGITIRIPPDFDPTTLRRLLATLHPC
jgi:hypothetical protein